jgi:hypothetical protein
MSNIWERRYFSILIDLDCSPSKCDRNDFGSVNVLHSSPTKWDRLYCSIVADLYAGLNNVREEKQMWTVRLENGKAVTVAVLLISTVDPLCHLNFTDAEECWNLGPVCMCVWTQRHICLLIINS